MTKVIFEQEISPKVYYGFNTSTCDTSLLYIMNWIYAEGKNIPSTGIAYKKIK